MTKANDLVTGMPTVDEDGRFVGQYGALTKREYFAAMAMQGILSCSGGDATPLDNWDCTTFAQTVGRDVVKYADALIAALNETTGDKQEERR